MNLAGAIHLNKTGLCVVCLVGLIFTLYIFAGGSTKSNPATSSRIDLGQLLRVALTAARNGGAEVVAVKDDLVVKSKGLTKEGLVDSVTTADYLSHCAILATLRHHFPHHHRDGPRLTVVSEESKAECDPNQKVDFALTAAADDDDDDRGGGSRPARWVDAGDVTVWIDPLDATLEYTEKLYEYVTTMVCVAVKGVPIIGVIHRPFTKKTSWAWVGQARSPDLINPTEDVHREKLKVIISRSHSGQIKDILDRESDKYEIVVAAGAGYKALEVASGAADAYLHTTAIKKWDVCAGDAILRALGGKMTTKFGEPIDYNRSTNSAVNDRGLVATLKADHEQFIGKL